MKRRVETRRDLGCRRRRDGSDPAAGADAPDRHVGGRADHRGPAVSQRRAREAARQAGSGIVTNSQVQQVAVNYIRNALGDTTGTMTQNLTVTVTVYPAGSPGTPENIDVTQAKSLDLIVISVSIPYQDVRWNGLPTITGADKPPGAVDLGLSQGLTRFPRRLLNLRPDDITNRGVVDFHETDQNAYGITLRRGAAVLETALVLNVLLLGLLGIFEYGRMVMIRQLMDNAAREGARLAVVGTAANPEVTTAQIQNTVISYLAGQSLSGVTVSVYQANPTTWANIGPWNQTPYGGAIAVEINATYVPIIPTTFGILPNPMPLKVGLDDAQRGQLMSSISVSSHWSASRFPGPGPESERTVTAMVSPRQNRRRGSVAPVIGVSLVALCGAVALAIDVGRIAVAKLQCQSAADVAAMAGARTLNGIIPQDLASATTNAQNAALDVQDHGATPHDVRRDRPARDLSLRHHGAGLRTVDDPAGGRELQPDQGLDHQVMPHDLRPGLRLLGVQRDGHGHGRASAPRRRHRPGLFRVDEQRERPLEQRELSRQRHSRPRTTRTRPRTTRKRSIPSSATTRTRRTTRTTPTTPTCSVPWPTGRTRSPATP